MKLNPTFAIVGAAGYVAPKHGAAIKRVGGTLLHANDVHAAAGWLDKDWKRCGFTSEPLDYETEPHQIPEWTALWTPDPVDWVVICTPNDLHRRMIELYIPRATEGVIVEKPLALSTADVDEIQKLELASGKRVRTILNLRHSGPALTAREYAHNRIPSRVSIRYYTPRGAWYDAGWKADEERSGGLIFNIGIHILDWIAWTLGEVHECLLTGKDEHFLLCELQAGRTKVDLRLSTDLDIEPLREISFEDGEAVFDLTNEFAELHTQCYREILAGRGPTVPDARQSIALAERLR